MNIINWDGSLNLLVDEVNDDHRKLVDLYNMLLVSLADGDNISNIKAILEELIACTAWHFKHEERLMLKYGFNGYEDHKAEHQDLIEAGKELQEKFLDPETSINDQDIEDLEVWLIGHILGPDKDMCEFLSQVM